MKGPKRNRLPKGCKLSFATTLRGVETVVTGPGGSFSIHGGNIEQAKRLAWIVNPDLRALKAQIEENL